MLKRLAMTLMDRADLSLSIDGPDAPPVEFIDECETLIADRVLERRVEDFGVRLAFVDDDFCAFMAAIAVDRSFTEALSALLRRGDEFPPARRVAAFLVARVIANEITNVEKIYAVLGDDGPDLLHTIGEFDSDSFLALLPILARSSTEDALHLVTELLQAGFPRLACRGAELLETVAPPDYARETRWLLANTQIAVDDLVSARDTLLTIAEPPTAAVLYLLGEVAIARGRLNDAQKWYSEILELPDISDANRANALHGLGDVIGTRGTSQKAKERAVTMIQQAIDLYPKDPPTKDLAEAWGDLGEFLGEAGRIAEARGALDESHRLNDMLPVFYPGMMIVEGLRGFIDLLDDRIDSAKTRLKRCRDAVWKLGFRWRTAWCDSKLAIVAEREGDFVEAERLRARAAAIFADLVGPEEVVH
jgi:tetratricopeptide (TPR) repeat protein